MGFCMSGMSSLALAQSLQDGFRVLALEPFSIAALPDGRVIVGGRPHSYWVGDFEGGLNRRLVNGRPDPSFQVPAGLGEVSRLLPLPNGHLLAGLKRLADGPDWMRAGLLLRLNPAGLPDPGFDLGMFSMPSPESIIRDRQGSVWTASSYELRKSAPDGSLQVRWFANSYVNTVCLGLDNSVWAGGSFTTLGPMSRPYLVRLNEDGSMAAAPPVILDREVTALARQDDGRLLMAGAFSSINGVSRSGFARLLADGTLDSSFTPNVEGSIFCIEPQHDGRVLIGGSFSSVDGQPQHWLARVNADGSHDSSFVGEANEHVHDIEVLADGRILATGVFSRGDGGETFVTTVARMSEEGRLEQDTKWYHGDLTCGALRLDGTLIAGIGNLRLLRSDRSKDPAFNHEVNAKIICVGAEPSGAVVFGGLFSQVDGLPRHGLARVDASGVLDASFTPALGSVHALLRLPDGRWIVGGGFSSSQAHGLARLHANGTLDGTFSAETNGTVMALSRLSDGRLIAGGAFTSMGGQPRFGLARLSADGVVDPHFAPVVDGSVKAVQALPDGGCLIGGYFREVNGASCEGLARLMADGSVDSSFQPPAKMDVNDLAVRMDGVIQVAGQRQNPATSEWLPELVLLNPDGSLNHDLMPKDSGEDTWNASQGAVRYIQACSDGRMDVGGDFIYYRRHPVEGRWDRAGIARSSAPAGTFQRLGISRGGHVLTWTRRGGLAFLENVSFEVRPSSGAAWQPLGAGQSLGNGEWAISGLNLTPGWWQVRAVGQMMGGEASWNALTSWLEARPGTAVGFDLWLEQRHGLRSGDVADTASERSVDSVTGVPDLLAYATGQTANHSGQPLVHSLLPQGTSSGDGAPGVSFPLWPAHDDIVLKVESAEHLQGPWREIARKNGLSDWQASVAGIQVVTEPDGQVKVHENQPLVPGVTRFFRISVSLMNP